jgi:hypothetical protein
MFFLFVYQFLYVDYERLSVAHDDDDTG